MSNRFLPSLGQLHQASKKLPDPEICEQREYSVSLNGESRSYELTFRRVKFSSRISGKTYKWVYEGKVMLNLKEEDSSKFEGLL